MLTALILVAANGGVHLNHLLLSLIFKNVSDSVNLELNQHIGRTKWSAHFSRSHLVVRNVVILLIVSSDTPLQHVFSYCLFHWHFTLVVFCQLIFTVSFGENSTNNTHEQCQRRVTVFWSLQNRPKSKARWAEIQDKNTENRSTKASDTLFESLSVCLSDHQLQ